MFVQFLRPGMPGQSARVSLIERTAGRYVMAAEELELDESAELTGEAGRSVLLRAQGRPVPERSLRDRSAPTAEG